MTFFISNKPVVCCLPNDIGMGIPHAVYICIACMSQWYSSESQVECCTSPHRKQFICNCIKGICSILDIITLHTFLEFIFMINILVSDTTSPGWCRYHWFQLFNRLLYFCCHFFTSSATNVAMNYMLSSLLCFFS